MSANLAEVPIIVVIDDPWGPRVSAVFAYGADDYVLVGQVGELRRKLKALLSDDVSSGSRLLGTVALADTNRERRVQFARHLRRMGFDVCFALDVKGIPDDPSVKLVVAHHRLPPHGVGRGLSEYRHGNAAQIPWIIVGTEPELTAVKATLFKNDKVTFFDVSADPAQVVFAANQLLLGSDASMRRSQRLRYGSPLRFNLLQQPAQWGYTFNISRGGLYVRTLTPPELGNELTLQFRAPFGRGRVELTAQVVWRQSFSRSKGYPSGFGLQYSDVQLADAAALKAGYDKLLEQMGAEQQDGLDESD
jgi:Tfp pilus assembly protein PilZ